MSPRGSYHISKNQLVKVVQRLGGLAYVNARRGRGGGVLSAKAPEEINLGRLVEQMEPHLNFMECFDLETNTCPIAPACDLKNVLGEAQQSFLQTLRRYTIAGLGIRDERLRKNPTDPRRRRVKLKLGNDRRDLRGRSAQHSTPNQR